MSKPIALVNITFDNPRIYQFIYSIKSIKTRAETLENLLNLRTQELKTAGLILKIGSTNDMTDNIKICTKEESDYNKTPMKTNQEYI